MTFINTLVQSADTSLTFRWNASI